MDDFARKLGDAVAVGSVGPRSVRLWARAESASRPLALELFADGGAGWVVVARGHLDENARPRPATDHTCAFTLPDEVQGMPPLDPDRAYVVRITREDGRLVGEARFHTAWDGAGPACGRLSFGMASCHQPFDGQGRVRPESARMLAASERALRQSDARFLLLIGDQIYADYPPKRSLFNARFFRQVAPHGRREPTDCTREEIRRLYHERYRIFFGVDGFSPMQSGRPCFPMLDDHEIRDNFGSRPGDASPPWTTLREGALDAFYDYQASRVLPGVDGGERPPSLHYGFVYGPVAVFVADLRSRRTADRDAVHVFGDGQVEELARFLAANAHVPVMCVVVTVPIVHLESWLASALTACAGRGSDAADRWTDARMIADRDVLLRVLRRHQCAHPNQRMLLLSGDIHVGSALRLDWSDGGPPLFQLTASALTHLQSGAKRWGVEALMKTTDTVAVHDGPTATVHLVAAAHGAAQNPYGGLNLGIVDVEWGEPHGVRFRLMSARRDESDAPRTVFESPLL